MRASDGHVWRFANDPQDNVSFNRELKVFIEGLLQEGCTFVAHNGLSFDVPVLKRLADVSIPFDRLIDTLVLSYLYNPSLEGGHSLEAYGDRLRHYKIHHDDWSHFSNDMMRRCEGDVILLRLVYDALSEKMSRIGFSELSCYIEHKTRELVDRQSNYGFWFNIPEAEKLRDTLRQRETDLAIPIQKLFPPELVVVGTYTRKKRKDGSDYESYNRHLDRYPQVVDNGNGSYDVYDWETFNIGSPTQRLKRLLRLGFESDTKTPSGNPKVDEESLLKFYEKSGLPEVEAMANWLVCNGRANMVETWLTNVSPDGRMHGRVITCGATTRRMTHSRPNTANIPSAAKAQYGHECRSLWSVEPRKGLKLVGADASGLETVGLLHYLGNKKAEEILTKKKPDDVHSMNARALTTALGREIDREWGAKTSWYAWLYGAYPPKLGQIVRGPKSDGDVVIDTFFRNVPGLQGLIDDVQSEWKKGKGILKCVDGGYVRCPSINAALNYRIQSLGSVVMKLAAMTLRDLADEKGVWYETVAVVHDEWQMETQEKDADILGQLAVKAISQAAEELNFKLPLGGLYSIGDTWASTH